MVLCDLNDCKHKVHMSGTGFCRYCKLNFCNIHRLQEAHICSELSIVKLDARNNLSKRLTESKVLSKKIQKI